VPSAVHIQNDLGELIAELRNNEWQLNKDLIFDRNYSDFAVEVRDRSGKVVLHVANLDTVTFTEGIFQCKSGRVFSANASKKREAWEICFHADFAAGICGD
jgi:hypothetical protein